MKWLTFMVATICVYATGSSICAEDARATFLSLYGTQLEQVKSTSTRADDVALAKQFMDAARQSAEVPDLAVILCNEAHGLTRLFEPSVALEAMRLLASISEKHRTVANENIIKLLTTVWRTANATDRDAAVDELITIHSQQGDASFKENRFREADVSYRRALVLATQGRHPSVDTLKAKIMFVADRIRTLRRVKQLEEALLRDANDQDTLKELILTYLLDVKQPNLAARHLPRVKNAELKNHLGLAMKKLSALNAADSMALGEWYLTLSKTATDKRASTARQNAASAFERFLLLHTTKDIRHTKAQLLLTQLKSRLEKDGLSTSAPGVIAPRVSFRPPSDVTLAIHLPLDEDDSQSTLKDVVDSNRPWSLKGTKRVPGPVSNARQFNGSGDRVTIGPSHYPSPSSKHMVAAMWMKADTGSGVLFSVGGNERGYALHLIDSVMYFSARIGGRVHAVKGTKKLPSGWTHVAVDVQLSGQVTLIVNGILYARGKVVHILHNKPGQPFCLGTDTESPVGRYNGQIRFTGAIDDFKMWLSK